MTVDAIAGKALKEQDPELLDALNKIEAGSGKLGKTQYARKKIQQTEERIAQQLQEERRQARLARERREEQAMERLATELHNRLKAAEDPAQVETEDIYGTAAQFSPFAVDKLKDIKENYVEDKFQEDPDVKRELQVGVIQGDVSREDVVEALSRGDINPDTADSMINDLDDRDNAEGPYQNDVLTDYSDRLHSTIAGNEGAEPMTRRLANEAVYKFKREYASWLTKNPEVSEGEMREKAQKLYDEMASTYSRSYTTEMLEEYKRKQGIGDGEQSGSEDVQKSAQSDQTSGSDGSQGEQGDTTQNASEDGSVRSEVLGEDGEGQTDEEVEEVNERAADAGWQQTNPASTGINYDEPLSTSEMPSAPVIASPDDLRDMDAAKVHWETKPLFESLQQLRKVTEQYPDGPVAEFLHSNGIDPRQFAQVQARLLRQQPGATQTAESGGESSEEQQDDNDNEESSEE
jgi:hypothetical protein